MLRKTIPLASVAFGYVLRKKGLKWKKNVVIGVIFTALLCLYGSFYFLVPAQEFPAAEAPAAEVFAAGDGENYAALNCYALKPL